MSIPYHIYTIYWNPQDFPKKFVVRCFDYSKNPPEPQKAAQVADTLEQARGFIPRYMTCMGRATEDDPVIIESWM